jgi:hypothetical protein
MKKIDFELNVEVTADLNGVEIHEFAGESTIHLKNPSSDADIEDVFVSAYKHVKANRYCFTLNVLTRIDSDLNLNGWVKKLTCEFEDTPGQSKVKKCTVLGASFFALDVR